MAKPLLIFKNLLCGSALFLVSGLAFSSNAWAQSNVIQITGVSGASNYTAGTAQDSPKIFAGIAGADCGSGSTTATCNNCTTGGSLDACNPRRIHTSLVLTVSFTVTGDLTGFMYMFAKASGGSPSLATNQSRSSTSQITKNSSGSISVSWGSLCPDLGAGACDNPVTSTSIYICVLPNTTFDASKCIEIPTAVHAPTTTTPIDCQTTRPSNYAVCRFDAFPGDEKVTIEELDLTSTNSDNVPATKMVVLASETHFSDIDQTTYNDGIVAELDVDSAGDVSPDVVDGLTNDVTYFFRAAVMDSAYNLYYFTSDAEIEDYCGDVLGNLDATDDATCKYIATPSKVYGLLTEDFNCFITTAAYGSSFAPKVNDFRAFRNRFLVPSELGRKIIFYYYDVGPKAARWLGEHAWAKPIVRAALFPAWLFAQTANVLGLTAAIVFFVSLSILLLCGIYILRTSHQRRVTI